MPFPGAPKSPAITLAPHPLYHIRGGVGGSLTAEYGTLAPHHFYHFPGGEVGGSTTKEGTRFQVNDNDLSAESYVVLSLVYSTIE